MDDRVLITGGRGFVGRALVERILLDNPSLTVIAPVRDNVRSSVRYAEKQVADFSHYIDWRPLLLDVKLIVHCAARVHIMKELEHNPLLQFRKINVDATLSLARQAASAGVKRFIFISSVKVNGQSTLPGCPFTADDMPAPFDAYGISKQEAEEGLRLIALQTGMDVVIIRPPLIYGSGVKANFASLIRWIRRGVPLPLGAINNCRSFIGLDNLVDFIHVCMTHTAAANQTFLVSDGDDVSTTQLLRKIVKATESRSWLIPVPSRLLELTASLLGKRDVASRLCDSLQVDIQKTRQLLGWTPPVTFDAGLKKTVEATL